LRRQDRKSVVPSGNRQLVGLWVPAYAFQAKETSPMNFGEVSFA